MTIVMDLLATYDTMAYRHMANGEFWRACTSVALGRIAELHRDAARKDDTIAALRDEIRRYTRDQC